MSASTASPAGGARPKSRSRRAGFQVAGANVGPGRRAQLEVPIARLVSGASVGLPLVVLHGSRDGPCIWLSAAVHGDELCGVEIIRRVLASLDPRAMAGTVLAVPVANVYGFNTGDRYLPDRRDLNRSFPGSPRGSLAARIAHVMMTEVIARCQAGIDLHTGSDSRINLPQIRADLDDEPTRRLAEVFGAPIAIHSRTRDGSLRQAATDAGATVLLFEGGEASRFDPAAITAGTEGTLRFLQELGLVESAPPAAGAPEISRRTTWVRAARSGIVHLRARLGEHVAEGATLATIRDPFGNRLSHLTTRSGGMVIGLAQQPLLYRGDAVAHVAELMS